MAEQTVGRIIVAAALPKGKSAQQQAELLGRQSICCDLPLGKALCASAVRGTHEESSVTSCHTNTLHHLAVAASRSATWKACASTTSTRCAVGCGALRTTTLASRLRAALPPDRNA